MSESSIPETKQTNITEKEILKISTDLQCELINKLVVSENNKDLLSELLNDITQKAHKSLTGDACSIFVNDKENKKSISTAGTGHYQKEVGEITYPIKPQEEVPDEPKFENEKLGLTGWIISAGRAFISTKMEDLASHPHHIGKGIPDEMELSAFLGVPLRAPRGIVKGAIKVERYKPSPEFSIIEQILLENFAQIASRCIAHVQDAKGGNIQKNAAVTAWVLDVIAEAVLSEEELDAFLNILVRVVSAASIADSCSIYLIDESKKTLTQRAGFGSQGLQKGIRSYKLPISDPVSFAKISDLKIIVPKKEKIGITAWIAYTEKPYYAKNFEELRKHPHHTGNYDPINFREDEKCGAWYGVPVRIGGNTIGVLKIENISPKDNPDIREFSNEVRKRIDSLSQHVALAIERSQFRIKSGKTILQDASKTIFKILRGNLEVKELVNNVVHETAKLFNARACALFLKEGDQLIQPKWAAVGWALKGEEVRKYDLVDIEDIKENPEQEKKVGLTVWIAGKREKFYARSNLELIMHPHHKGTFDKMNFLSEEKCESFMGIPLIVGDELIGVLKVETKMREVDNKKEFTYFSEQDELAFEFISNSAAIAIQNSRLGESNVLADRVLAQPNNANVIRLLYKFIQDRVEWVNTLDSSAVIVQMKNEERARIFKNFTGLLRHDFRLFILDKLINLTQEDPLKSYFKFVNNAIRVSTIGEILNFELDEVFAITLDKNHFLNNNAELLVDIIEKVNENLKLYDYTVENRFRLSIIKDFLNSKNLSSRIESMNPFDISIVRRIVANIENIINDYYNKFHKVTSPYRAGMPLDADSKLFFGRGDIFKWIEIKINSHRHNVLVLHGGSRTGKTSILKQLEAGPLGSNLRLRDVSPIYPVFIDLHAFAETNTEIFLLTLAEKIWDKIEKQQLNIEKPKPNNFKNGYHFRAFEQFLKKVTDRLLENKNSILVVMLDEFETIDELVSEGKIDKSINGVSDHLP